ncbi:MAG: nicotinate-nucleotide adenylyltransferase [Candidatus Binatia bacterium]
MCAEATRIGVLGGTFDPVHLGHLASAREIAAAYSLDRVLLVLAARPPHKRTDDAAPAELRWRMLTLAVEQAETTIEGPLLAHAGVLEACDIELRRSGPSFTVDTLHDLQRLHPDAGLFLILGIDAYEEIDTWSRPGEILSLASIIVTTRPGREFPGGALLPPVAARRDARYDPAIGAHVHTSGHIVSSHRIRGLEISATDIRNRVRSGLPVAHLTGDAVARFITEHRLYGSGDAASRDQPAADPAPPRSNGETRH